MDKEKINKTIEQIKQKYAELVASLKKEFSKHDKTQVPTDPRDLDFMNDAKKALLNEQSNTIRYFLYSLVCLIVILLIWAKFAVIEEVTVGTGTVIPSSHVKSIQTLDGGVLSELYVKQGDIVRPDQIIAKLTVSDFEADYLSTKNHYLTLLAVLARLKAEANNANTIDFPKALANEKELRENETRLFISRKKSLNERLQTLQTSLDIAQKQLNIMQPLVAKGIVSRMEVLQLQGNVNNIKGNISDEKNKFDKEVFTDLNRTQDEANTLQEKMIGLQDRIDRATLRSPVHGIVKQINVNTIGGVLKQGAELMQIVPLEDTLLIEARISPKDIAFIRPDEPAKVKFSAYDYSIYGGLDGKVEYISPDTVVDEKGNTYYLVHVRTNRSFLGTQKKPLPIIPGMIATVDILTGKKSVLDYLLKPFLKARYEALRER